MSILILNIYYCYYYYICWMFYMKNANINLILKYVF